MAANNALTHALSWIATIDSMTFYLFVRKAPSNLIRRKFKNKGNGDLVRTYIGILRLDADVRFMTTVSLSHG